MKIAIATIQSNNFGNRLQNYALQEILKTYGPVASLRREKITLTRQILRQLRKCVCRNAYREFDSLYITLSREILSVDCVSPDIADNYDMFVIGSDQIWNPTFSFNGPLDYLPMVPASKR